MNTIIDRIISALMLSLVCIASPRVSADTFTYQNPIMTMEPIRDPQIVKSGETWYLTGCYGPFDSIEESTGVKVWSSKDMLNWKCEGFVFTPSPQDWCQRRFRAPELFIKDGKYYLLFISPDERYPKKPPSVGLASANNILGPYKSVTEKEPMIRFTTDATLFRDDDGKTWIFISGPRCGQVDLDKGVISSPLKQCFKSDQDWWEDEIESLSVIKNDGLYYCFYSSSARGCEVGFAAAPEVGGPWQQYRRNPIYGAQDKGVCRKNEKLYTQPRMIPFIKAGNGSAFKGPDGRFWYCCHGVLPADISDPRLVMDPMDFDEKGVPHINLRWTPQKVKW
ncbi:MAG: family 43 glycosylhydrolase [Candidatus Sumerlaeota bacterium]|nr:family 43 glycosylhydrolase [Candidatus Sumerlaeota bacterium]